MTDSPDQQPKAEAKPVPAPATTPAPVVKPKLVPQKGWRNYSEPDKFKFKPTRNQSVKFIQARRAPGK